MNGRLCGFDIKLILVLNIKNGANHTMQIYTQYMNIICSYHNIQYLAANFASNFIVSEKLLQLVDALWLPTPNYTITSLRFEISWLVTASAILLEFPLVFRIGKISVFSHAAPCVQSMLISKDW